jgi:hypothetical protein
MGNGRSRRKSRDRTYSQCYAHTMGLRGFVEALRCLCQMLMCGRGSRVRSAKRRFSGMLRRLVAQPHPSRVAKLPSFSVSNPKTAALILRVAAVRAHQTGMGYPTRCRSWNDISSSSLIFTIMDCAARLRDIFTNTTYHNTPCLATRP